MICVVVHFAFAAIAANQPTTKNRNPETPSNPGSWSRTHTHTLGHATTHTQTDIDPQVLEIQRQNLITQKILQRYLERRLHPNRKPQIRVPSVEEILPKPFTSLAAERNVRQQNQSNSEGSSGSSNSTGARYDLFDGQNGRQYGNGDSEDQYGDEDGDGDYRDEPSRDDLDQYDDLGDGLNDNDRYDIESLQSGESEHVDSFYRDKYYSHQRQRGNYSVPTSVASRPVPL